VEDSLRTFRFRIGYVSCRHSLVCLVHSTASLRICESVWRCSNVARISNFELYGALAEKAHNDASLLAINHLDPKDHTRLLLIHSSAKFTMEFRRAKLVEILRTLWAPGDSWNDVPLSPESIREIEEIKKSLSRWGVGLDELGDPVKSYVANKNPSGRNPPCVFM
jgi:hypothetical protein